MTFSAKHPIPRSYWFVFVDEKTGRWTVTSEKFTAVGVTFTPDARGKYIVTYAFNVRGNCQHVHEANIFEDLSRAKDEVDARNSQA